jgi:ribosomal-protein-alanine N-acetyltransferase
MKTIMQLFQTFPTIQINDHIILRRFEVKDIKRYFEFYNIPSVNRFIPDGMIPKTPEDAKKEVEAIIQTFDNKQTFYWAIADKKTDKLIGGCGFHDWNRYNARIELAYDLHPDFWRKGIITACLAKVIKFGFMEMGIVRMQATTVIENEASNQLLLKFGFKYEGLLRKYKFFKNKMVDVLMFSYTIDDFRRDVALGRHFSGLSSNVFEP